MVAATLVPAMIQACLLRVPDVRQRQFAALRIIYYGSSPIAPDTLRDAMATFRCDFAQAYGMTENTAASTITPVDARHPGHVGAPMPSNEIKLVDLPDMGYRASDAPCPRGEIHTRGANVFMGYLHDPARTKEAGQ